MMDTLGHQKNQLEKEIAAARDRITHVRRSQFPDLKLLKQLTETIERNTQLVDMIALHLNPTSQQQGAD